jgi:hypothetical protein
LLPIDVVMTPISRRSRHLSVDSIAARRLYRFSDIAVNKDP